MTIPNQGSILAIFRSTPRETGQTRKFSASKTTREPRDVPPHPSHHSPIIGSCSSQNTCAAKACAAPALRTA